MHNFPAHWGPQGQFAHRTPSGVYGPSRVGESREDYKARLREAYGSLRGVEIIDNIA